jgi:hypothetical protein
VAQVTSIVFTLFLDLTQNEIGCGYALIAEESADPIAAWLISREVVVPEISGTQRPTWQIQMVAISILLGADCGIAEVRVGHDLRKGCMGRYRRVGI